ncbi:MAG: methyl-accepting chemotaxis protein [Ktedonobacterales bacterium]
MELDASKGRSIGAQLNVLMIISTVVPALIVLGVGGWMINVRNSSGELPGQTLLLGATLLSLVVVVTAVVAPWLRMRSMVSSQALELADVCRQITSGNRSVRAPIVGDDEFAALAAAVNAVVDGAPASAGSALSPDSDAATLQAQIEKLLQEVSAVGDGDLRVQAEVTPDTLGVLADSFNYMIEELAKVVGRVQATTFQVTNATRRLLDRSAEVAQASDTQAQQIGQTSEAVARLADFVQLSANNALAAAEAARDALRNAEGGQQAVVQTIDGMVHIRENVQETSKKIKRLGERSQEVGEIVRLIEDIADQTNLLALNAAIQSAMAGEHGRGFAVVADEIRLLAERVTEATKRIATIVKSIQGDTFEAVVAMEESTQEVVNGSRLADEAGEALRSIYGAVDRQAKMIEGIARAANERAQTSEAVAAAMTRIADITHQTNSATQDTADAVSYLADLAEQLRASVATFRLPEQALQGAAMFPQAESAYPPMVNLPNLGSTGWSPEIGQLPALPPAPAGAMASSALTDFPPGFDFGGAIDGGNGYPAYNNGNVTSYDSYNPAAMPVPGWNPAPVQQQPAPGMPGLPSLPPGTGDSQLNQGGFGAPPLMSDMY